MAKKLSHTKFFDEPYLFNREAQILADLYQRAAPVPRVLSMDHVQKSLTMDHDGTSLESVITDLSQSPSVHKAWLSRLLTPLIQTVAEVCEQDVFHLDLACRNFLVNQLEHSEPQIKIIDFGLALCTRLPLQKPLWVIPDSKLHHPRLVKAAAEDWRIFFQDSKQAAAIYHQKNLATPAQFVDRPFDIPLAAYEAYWPRTVVSDSLGQRWCLVCHSFAALLEELSRRLLIPNGERQFLLEQAAMLRNLQEDSVAKERLLAIPLSSARMGGTPRPGRFDSSKPRAEPASERPPLRFLLTLSWLYRPIAISILLSNYFYIDTKYQAHQLILSDLGFYTALTSLVVSALAIMSLFSSRFQSLGIFALLVMCATQVWFGFEMASRGLGLQTSFVIGIGIATALGLIRFARSKLTGREDH